jgi:hypothetical protein
MWRLYKGFQSLPSAGGAAGPAGRAASASAPSPQPGASNPRIFQPPKL